MEIPWNMFWTLPGLDLCQAFLLLHIAPKAFGGILHVSICGHLYRLHATRVQIEHRCRD